MSRALPVLLLPALLAACGEEGPTPYQPAATLARTTPVDPESEPYFSTVWPDDRRLDADGFVDPSTFPNPGGGALFDTVRQKAARLVRGWSLSAPAYVPFTGPLDPASLPTDPAAFLEPGSPVVLVAIDPSSPAYARPVPLQWKYFEDETLFLPGRVLAVRPVPGLPLLPSTRYALVVTTALRDAAGAAVGPEEPLFRALLEEEPAPAFAEARAHFGPLARYLDAQGIARSSVAAATLFTTQPVLDELLALRDWEESLPVPPVKGLKFVRDYGTHRLFEGTYDAPWLLHGRAPYEFEGGEFRYDATGTPVPALVEAMRLAVCVPSRPVPAAGFPVVFYSHGTGGSFESVARESNGACGNLAAEGIAAFGIDQVLTGPRAQGATTCLGVQPVENCFLNVVNPVAGRNLLRHAALDHVLLRRVAEALVVPAAVDPAGRTIRFDLANYGFFGHSQGGLTGAIYAAIDTRLAGALLSGAGGHMTTTILERVENDPRGLAEGPLFLNIKGRESLEQLHPALALVQTLAESTDPLSWARYWLREPPAGSRRKSVFVTSGLADPFTPGPTAAAMAVAGGVPQMTAGHVDYAGFALAGLEPVAAPVQGNIAASGALPAVTALFRQFPGADHYPIFDDATARAQYRAFFRTLVAGDAAPTIPAP